MKLPATPMLVLVTLLWGLTFPLGKEWQNAAQAMRAGKDGPSVEYDDLLSSLTLMGLRMTLSALVLIGLQPKLLFATRREHGGGMLVGVLFTIGCGFQFVGLARTTPALSAFITSLASAWVPVLAFVLLRIRVSPVTLLGLAVGLAGVGLLPDDWTLEGGEGLTFLSTIPFAVQILLVDRLGKRLNPAHLTIGMLGVAGLSGLLLAAIQAWSGPGLTAWLEATAYLLTQPRVLAAFLGLVALGVVTFHWMNVYQPRVPASRAALIYLLEPVFASLFSIAFGYERLTGHLLAGGGLIIVGNLLAELPGRRRKAPEAHRLENRLPEPEA